MKKTLLVNLYVIIFLLLTAEFSWRLVLTIKNFDKLNNKYSNYFGRTWHRVNSVNLGQFDKKLICRF